MGDVASVARNDETVVLVVHDLCDLADLGLDHFDAVACPSVVVYLYDIDVVLLYTHFTALLLQLITFELLVSDKDQQLSAKLVSANSHRHRHLPEARALRVALAPQVLQPVANHRVKGLLLSILLHFDHLYLLQQRKNNQLKLAVVGHEHRTGGLHWLRSVLARDHAAIFLVVLRMGVHDVLDRHFLGVVEAHVVILKLITFLERLFVAFEVDRFD